MGRHHAVVVVGGGYKSCGIGYSGLEIMQGRVAQQILEHLGAVLTGAVAGSPVPADCELVVAEHIHYAHLRYGNGIQFRTLRHAGAHQQAAVGAAHDGQVRGTCISLLYQPLGSRYEVVEHILLVHLGARQVPGLAVLAATAEIHLCVYAAPLEEGYACG